MRTIVLGAGVIGVTTAYYLAAEGHEVTVVDRASNVASATSHANGGQLSYGFADALATPAFARTIPALLAGRNFASKIRVTPRLIPWGLKFLAQCTSWRARSTAITMLTMAKASAELMSELQEHVDIDFSFRPAGKLVLLSTAKELQSAERTTEFKRKHGFDIEILSRNEAEALEPAIRNFDGPVKAAAFSKTDDVADARRFSTGLRNHLEQQHGVRFHLGASASKLLCINDQVTGVSLNGGDESIFADAVVVCLGAWSDEILHPLRIRTHVFPVRGYSLTLPIGANAPAASVTSLTNRFVFSRLNGSMRIAGFTDFDDFRSDKDTERIATLRQAAKRLAPTFADYDCDDHQPWGGFRPMTPSGIPLVGPSKVPGLYLNTGHGMLGWTLACATAQQVAQSIQKDEK
ncbi:MAG: FAD-dependent oxidoreductase [Woeseiaceae bacterium]|nr:FAD-dependent oxidoreductase [Woeseiaceae bacterium]